MTQMRVEISFDNMGYLEVDPVSEKRKRQYQNRIIAWHREGAPQLHTEWQRESTEEWLRRGAVVFIQQDFDIESALEDFGVTRSERADLDEGWPVRKLVPVDLFERYFEDYSISDPGGPWNNNPGCAYANPAYGGKLDPDQETLLNQLLLIAANDGDSFPNARAAVTAALTAYRKSFDENLRHDFRVVRPLVEQALRDRGAGWR